MRKFVIGNWKMNGDALEVHEYVHELKTALEGMPCSVGVAVPFLYLPQLTALLGRIPVSVVAQDVSQFKGSGAYTGEISAAMLRDAGCEYVLIGHSERRQYFDEDEMVLQQKLLCACEAGLNPIYCVGEDLNQRLQGEFFQVLDKQLEALEAVRDHLPATVWVAYEPVWAIGTGKVASAEQIAEVHAFLATRLQEILPARCSARLLYGGSVKSANAREILALPGVDGVLVGSASLTVAELRRIIEEARAMA